MDRRRQLTEDLGLVHVLRRPSDLDDRTVAIISCAYLEDALEEAIAVRLPGLTDGLRSKMFAPGSGLAGSFGAKTDLAVAVRAIGLRAAGDLRTMAKIRNKFAHHIRVSAFDSDDVRDLVSNLKRLDEVGSPLETMPVEDGMSSGRFMEWDDRSLRGRFIYTAVVLTGGIYNASIDAGWGLIGCD